MKKILIAAGKVTATAELDDSMTAAKIYAALPISGSARVWGDEIYFDIPLALDPAPEARAGVDVGELGYWPVGKAFCIFFGPTPASTGDRPRAYSPVNVFGRIVGDATCFAAVTDGAEVTVVAATE